MSLSFRRYQDPPKSNSSFIITTRNTASKQKLNPMNSSFSLPKNPQIDIKLPSLSRSSMRKSFSTFQSDRNTKFKLQTLQDKLQQIKHNLHNTRQQAKETIDFTKFLRQNLFDKQMSNMTKDLKQKIQGLQNYIKNTIYQQKSRSNDLRDGCNKLWDSNQQLKNLNFQLRMRVEAIQRKMGYKN